MKHPLVGAGSGEQFNDQGAKPAMARAAAGKRAGLTAITMLAIAGLLVLSGCTTDTVPADEPGSLHVHINGQTGVSVGGLH